CSYSEEEDEEILNWLSKEFNVLSLKLSVEENWNIIEVISSKGIYGYRFYPDKVKGEGFFIAAFKKQQGDERDFKSSSVQTISKNEMVAIKDWVKEEPSLFFFKQADNIVAIPEQWKNDLALLQKKLYLRKAGVTVGSLK